MWGKDPRCISLGQEALQGIGSKSAALEALFQPPAQEVPGL